MKRPLVAIALAVSLTGLTACGGAYQNRIGGSYDSSYTRGSKALRAKDFDLAAEQYAFAASSGHPKALIAYGKLFARGQGVEQDPARAAALFEEAYGKASSYKNKAAMELGQLLMEGGDGPSGSVEPDGARARSLLMEALNGGERRAASRLGRIYEKGIGVEPDPAEAIAYYRQAPENDAFSARDLARLLASQNAADAEIASAAQRAVTAFEAKGQAGSSGAWVQLADIYSRDEIVEADPERARGYLEKLSDPDDPKMQIRLARLYARIGDRQERNRMLRLAADGGDVRAQTELARLYLRPRSADTNGAVGRYYAERAIGGKSEAAMVYLGLALLRGGVLEPDPVSGETLLRRAQQGGHLPAAVALGGSILRGDVRARTPDEGRVLLEEAAGEGSADAMSVLGFAYLGGNGLPEDEALALEWLKKAADGGNKRAKTFLADRGNA